MFAVVTQEEQVDVYRLGGQRAFTVKRKGPSISVIGLRWIRDGLSPLCNKTGHLQGLTLTYREVPCHCFE